MSVIYTLHFKVDLVWSTMKWREYIIIAVLVSVTNDPVMVNSAYCTKEDILQ